jgi:DNA repair protein RecO (recombination protein O)
MPTVKDNAICLRLADWSETSQIAVLLTERHGKLSATAKGAKRQAPSSLAKFSGGVELGTGGEAVLMIKNPNDLANLIEWDLRRPHWRLRQSLSAYRLGMYALDLAHHLVHDHDPHPRTYEALRDFLADLDRRSDHPAALLRFQWTLVVDLGYEPVLDRDAQTDEPLPDVAETAAFSAEAGGLVADTGAPDRWRVRMKTVQSLRAVASGEDPARFDEPTLDRANRLLCVYFRALLDKQLPTMDYILNGE